jgi:hypothetical protein
MGCLWKNIVTINVNVANQKAYALPAHSEKESVMIGSVKDMFEFNLDPTSWKAFLESVCQWNPDLHESCAWLYCDKPFSDDHTVYVFPIKNVGLKGLGPSESFAPDKEDYARVKAIAKQKKLTRIGNVHTHVFSSQNSAIPGTELLFTDPIAEKQYLPSDIDLNFARRFNSIVRGIVSVLFSEPSAKGTIIAILWHDQFGNILKTDFFDYTIKIPRQ